MNEPGGLEPAEALDVVARRARFIECLLDGPKYNRDIRDALDVSRSTAYKAVRELESLDMASRCDDGYELTNLGRLLYAEYERALDRIEEVCRPGHLLSILPTDTDISFGVLDGASVFFAHRHAPNRPVREIESVVEAATAVRGTGPVVLPRYVELFHEQILAGELDAELVVERQVLQYLVSDYAQDYEEAIERENFAVSVTDGELPYALLVVDEPTPQVGIIVYDQQGELRGFIRNDSAAAHQWGCERWEEARNVATPVTSETFD